MGSNQGDLLAGREASGHLDREVLVERLPARSVLGVGLRVVGTVVQDAAEEVRRVVVGVGRAAGVARCHREDKRDLLRAGQAVLSRGDVSDEHDVTSNTDRHTGLSTSTVIHCPGLTVELAAGACRTTFCAKAAAAREATRANVFVNIVRID